MLTAGSTSSSNFHFPMALFDSLTKKTPRPDFMLEKLLKFVLLNKPTHSCFKLLIYKKRFIFYRHLWFIILFW